MALSRLAITEIAHRFLFAEERCIPLEPVSQLYPGLTEAEAYRVQHAIVTAKTRQGGRIVGHKVGATSQAIQKQLGVSEPVYGYLFQVCQVPDGGMIELARLIHPRIECEIAFLLGKDLPGPGVTESDVLTSSQAVLASLEINDPRTKEWKINSLDIIADNSLAARFVIGEQRTSPKGLDLSEVKVVMRKNGQTIASATGAVVLGHPARSVAWLANKLTAHHQQPLKAGEIVLPGSLTPVFPVAAGDHFEAEFDTLGRVAVSFV